MHDDTHTDIIAFLTTSYSFALAEILSSPSPSPSPSTSPPPSNPPPPSTTTTLHVKIIEGPWLAIALSDRGFTVRSVSFRPPPSYEDEDGSSPSSSAGAGERAGEKVGVGDNHTPPPAEVTAALESATAHVGHTYESAEALFGDVSPKFRDMFAARLAERLQAAFAGARRGDEEEGEEGEGSDGRRSEGV